MTGIGDFTSDSSGEDAERIIEIDRQDLVLMLCNRAENLLATISHEKDEADKDKIIRQQLQVKLGHPSKENGDRITERIVRPNTAAFSLRDLSPPDAPYRRQFELTGEKPVYHSARRLGPKHNDIVQKKL